MPCTILLIEDNDTDARVVQDILRQSTQEWQVVRARTLTEATQRLQEITPDLMLMDLGLPDVQGSMTLLAFFDAYSPGRRLPPIVVLSNADEEGTACRTFGGTTGFATKGTMMEQPATFMAFLATCIEQWHNEQRLVQRATTPPETQYANG